MAAVGERNVRAGTTDIASDAKVRGAVQTVRRFRAAQLHFFRTRV